VVLPGCGHLPGGLGRLGTALAHTL
jgi:hypothetical protein